MISFSLIKSVSRFSNIIGVTQNTHTYKGKYVKIKFCTQLPSSFPQFAFFCNLPDL